MKAQNFYKNILVILGVVSLGFFVSYYFVYKDIKKKSENISILTQKIALESSRQDYLESTQRMITNISSDIDRINNSIVSVDGNVQFIEDLETVAKSNGLSITIESLLIEDNPAFSDEKITTLKVKAKTRGNWAGTYNFLRQIESLPFKIKINQFGMQSISDNTDSENSSSNNDWQSLFEIRVLKYK